MYIRNPFFCNKYAFHRISDHSTESPLNTQMKTLRSFIVNIHVYFTTPYTNFPKQTDAITHCYIQSSVLCLLVTDVGTLSLYLYMPASINNYLSEALIAYIPTTWTFTWYFSNYFIITKIHIEAYVGNNFLIKNMVIEHLYLYT